MAFPMIIKKKLFDALWERARNGQKAPSLRFVAKSEKLATESDAERLLLEMQADGAIVVVKGGAYPWLTLRRNSYSGSLIAGVWLDPEKMERQPLVPQAADAPSPAIQLRAEVERRLPAEFEAEYPGASGTAREAPSAEASASATRITDRAPSQPEPKAIKTPSAPPKMPERPEVETVEAQQEGTPTRSPLPASVDQGPRPARPPAQAAEEVAKRDAEPPQAVEARHRPPELVRRKLAVFLTPVEFDQLDSAAVAREVFAGKLASELLSYASALCSPPMPSAQGELL